MRKKKIEVAEYVNGEYVFNNGKEKIKSALKEKVAPLVAGLSMIPAAVFAESDRSVDETFGNVHKAILNAVDSGVVLVIIFAGCAWMAGHRPKALQILIGVACGYLIISHSVNLRDFLKSI